MTDKEKNKIVNMILDLLNHNMTINEVFREMEKMVK